jgi:hypothetical protein
MERSLRNLLESWSEEVSARANRVRSLIGDAHWLSDGVHKERLIQEFLVPRLPTALTAEHGFLLDLANDACSNEIDVFVRDTSRNAPLLNECGLSICHPRSVLAYWEVKSDFKASSLAAALQLILNTQGLIERSRDCMQVWRAVCFTAMSEQRSDQSILETITVQLAQTCDRVAVGKDCWPFLPTCITCLDSFCAFVTRPEGGGRGRVKYFPVGRLGFATAMADMLAHVYAQTGLAQFQPLEEAVAQIVSVTPMINEF